MTTVYSNINEAVLRNVPKGSTVLDVGCGSGILGAELKKKGCTVYGLDYDVESLQIAKTRLDYVMRVDIEKSIPKLKKQFDVIIFADILEHMRFPDKVLKQYLSFLKQNGRIIVSLPNIANWTIRTKLLFGNFTPTETGFLDKTHLKFYTLTTARRLLKNSGLSIVKIDLMPYFARFCIDFARWVGVLSSANETNAQLLSSNYYKFYRKTIMPIETGVARLWKRLFAGQFVFVARKK